MAAKKKKPKNGMDSFLKLIILPLLAVDSYAFWKLKEASGHWSFSFIPTSIPDTLTQLAAILAINISVIVLLLIYIYRHSI